MNRVSSRGLSDEVVTHMNSAVKGLFVRVLFVETSGTPMQYFNFLVFSDFYRFECYTLKIRIN